MIHRLRTNRWGCDHARRHFLRPAADLHRGCRGRQFLGGGATPRSRPVCGQPDHRQSGGPAAGRAVRPHRPLSAIDRSGPHPAGRRAGGGGRYRLAEGAGKKHGRRGRARTVGGDGCHVPDGRGDQAGRLVRPGFPGNAAAPLCRGAGRCGQGLAGPDVRPRRHGDAAVQYAGTGRRTAGRRADDHGCVAGASAGEALAAR